MSNYILVNGTLYHHGIKGQKWGTRRYQYEDGSLTPEGREHYGYGQARATYKQRIKLAKQTYKLRDKSIQDDYFKKLEKIEKPYKRGQKLSDADYEKETKLDERATKAWADSKKRYKEDLKKAKEEYRNSEEYKQAKDKAKKIAIAGAAVVATALAAYGVYKVANLKNDAMKAYISDGKRRADAIFNFNSAANIKARESGATGKMYYQMKNIHGDVIQKGSAKNFDSYQKMIADHNWLNANNHAKEMANVRRDAQQFKEGSLINAYKYLKNRK